MKNPYGRVGMDVTQQGREQIRGHQRAWIKPPKKASKGSLAMEPKGPLTRRIQSMSWSNNSMQGLHCRTNHPCNPVTCNASRQAAYQRLIPKPNQMVPSITHDNHHALIKTTTFDNVLTAARLSAMATELVLSCDNNDAFNSTFQIDTKAGRVVH